MSREELLLSFFDCTVPYQAGESMNALNDPFYIATSSVAAYFCPHFLA